MTPDIDVLGPEESRQQGAGLATLIEDEPDPALRLALYALVAVAAVLAARFLPWLISQ